MKKMLAQVILLTRKNLRVRFSHRYLTLCELGIPLLFSLVLGLVISNHARDEHLRERLEVTHNVTRGEEKNVENKFKCEDMDDAEEPYFEKTPYNCARRFQSINRINSTINVYEDFALKPEQTDQLPKRVVFVMAPKVAHSLAGVDLVDTVLKSGREQTKNTTVTYYTFMETLPWKERLKWERSEKTEREMEICMLQRQPSCHGIFAVVVVTEVEDVVKEEMRIRVDYTIRMTTTYNIRPKKLYRQPLFVDYSSPLAYYLIARLEHFYYTASWRTPLVPLSFLELQALVDEGIMKFVTNRLGKNANASNTDHVDISLVRMPFVVPDESWLFNDFAPFSLIGCLLASLPIFSLMRVNTEKSSGFKELLRMHGVTLSTQWMAWCLSSFIVYSIWTLCLALSLWLPFLGVANFLSLLNINVILYWLLLLLFMMAVTTFSYLTSVVFERGWTAASIGLLIWILFTVLTMLVSGIFHRLTTGSMMALMVIPTVAFDLAFRLILNGGGTLTNFGVPVIENVSLTMIHCLAMLVIDSGIYMTVAVYLDHVVPSKHGVSLSPWYIWRTFKLTFKSIFTNGGSIGYVNAKGEDDLSLEALQTGLPGTSGDSDRQPFEIDPEDTEAAVVLHNLKKQYRNSRKRAVDGLSAKMFTGEIYALLGFNGAGKTTTIGMLTGVFSPNSGWATIFDLDIRKDVEDIRRFTGLCPQHNILNDDISVLEQVLFFGMLKGIEDAEERAKEILTSLGLQDKLSSKSEELSKGQKRLVHLAIALIGHSKVVFLEEPTRQFQCEYIVPELFNLFRSLDPESRRRVWDFLLKLRGKVTIILTTHNMEEADILGDRVGIMSEGKMICSGTPSFVKKYYGLGYNLKMNLVGGHCNPNKVCQFVREYVPTATLDTGGQFPNENDNAKRRLDLVVSIILPTAQLNLSRVADMMEALQQQKSALGVDNIGLSLSTMDDVFLKVGEAARVGNIPAFDSCSRIADSSSSNAKIDSSQLQWYRYRALVLKRAAYYCHAPFTSGLLVLVFTCFLWLSIILLYAELELGERSDPPQIVSSSSLGQYCSPVLVFLHDSEMNYDGRNYTKSYALAYQNLLDRASSKEDGIESQMLPRNDSMANISKYLKTASLEDLASYRHKYLGGASFNVSGQNTNITGFYSAYGFHTAPLSLNLISQARIQKLHGVAADIRVVDHPIRKLYYFQYTAPESVTIDRIYFKVSGTVILLVITASLLTSTAAFLPAEERLNKGKQLQLMTGTTPFTYWMAMFTWDFVFFSLANIIITLVFFLAESNNHYKIFTGHGAWAVIYLILECYTFGALWFSYLVSWATYVKTPSDGFIIVNKFAVIVGVLANVIRHYLVQMTVHDFYYDKPDLFFRTLYYIGHLSGYVLWPVPMYSLYLSMMKLAAVGYKNNICSTFPSEFLHLACEKVDGFERSQNDTWFMHGCCGNCQDNCFQPHAYLNTSRVEFLEGYESHSLLFDLLAMIVSGLASALILYFLEYELPKMRAKRRYPKKSSEPRVNEVSSATSSQDEDVVGEAARIENIVKEGNLQTGFTAQNLTSTFDSVKSVNGISFEVATGECFGLLGVRGAGITATFRVITGDLHPTSGILFSGGQSYHEKRPSYLASMGYCPQFDGIIGRLTGLQMVKLYGALRGMSPGKLSEEARIWLDKFGLLGNANLKCAAYSGGMKRRLSVAMALIGNPQLILLDEPTSGVDPAFRRQFWNVIQQLKRGGRSILLTSYSTNECEVLCTRLGIMVNGHFKCLGSPRHIRNKFGQGYILTVKLKKLGLLDGSIPNDHVHRIDEKIAQSFPSSRVISQQKVHIQYQIPNKSLWYSDIFRAMEQIRNDPDVEQVIEDYTVTETSLEDVLKFFANESSNAR